MDYQRPGTLAAHPGCWNQPRADLFLVKDGLVDVLPLFGSRGAEAVTGYRLRELVDTSSRECRFDGRANEPRCRGCMK